MYNRYDNPHQSKPGKIQVSVINLCRNTDNSDHIDNKNMTNIRGRTNNSTELLNSSKRVMHTEQQIPVGNPIRGKKARCNCTITTRFEASSMPFLSIHNRRNRKPKLKVCPLSSKNRNKTINYIRSRYLRGEGPMIIELQANKAKNREMAMCRMWHYIDNTAFIIKQKGCKEEILSLVFELENLLTDTHLAKEQVERLLDAHKADRNMVDLQDTILIAEKTEAILGAEWNIRKNVQVNFIQHLSANINFGKMSNFEAKLNVIGSYTGDIQNFLAEILRDISKRNIDNARRFHNSLRLVAFKA